MWRRLTFRRRRMWRLAPVIAGLLAPGISPADAGSGVPDTGRVREFMSMPDVDGAIAVKTPREDLRDTGPLLHKYSLIP
jgi:hypothetical protein